MNRKEQEHEGEPTMTWLEEFGDDVRRREAAAAEMRRRQVQAVVTADAVVGRAQTLVRGLLDEMNKVLLGGRGSVWDTQAGWGVHLWELWWEPTREWGPYLVVTLLRDSRGTPYLKVQGRRLALEDTHLERRLQRALRAAFLQPRVYTPRVRMPAGWHDRDLLWPAPPLPRDASAPSAGEAGRRTMRGRRGRWDKRDTR